MTVPDPNNAGKTTLQNQNIGDVNQYGFEIDLSAPLTTTLDAGINYTYIYDDNRTNSDKITNVPEHKFFAYVKYTPVKFLSFLVDMETDSKRYSSSDGVRVAGDYTVVNAKATYEILKGLQIEGGVMNLMDEDYAFDEGYPQAGRTFFTNLTYRF